MIQPGRRTTQSKLASLILLATVLAPAGAVADSSWNANGAARLSSNSPLLTIRKSRLAISANAPSVSSAISKPVSSSPTLSPSKAHPLESGNSWASRVNTSASASQSDIYSGSNLQLGNTSARTVTHSYIPNPGSCVSAARSVPKFGTGQLGKAQITRLPAVLPVSGQGNAAMAGFDRELLALMHEWQVPGASISIVRKGKLIYSRAYGYSDFESRKAVEPQSRFRIGSISKIITSVSVLKLIEEGKLSLNSPAISILNYPVDNSSGRRPDPRLNQITIQNLLQCTGGWDRAHNGDPMFVPIAQEAALEYSNSMRPTPEAIIRYQLARPLDFTPGSRFSYSNLGYSILGEVISKTTSLKYSDFVQSAILAPMGICSLQPGKTRELAPGEVHYYGFQGENKGQSIIPNVRGLLPLEYGGDFYLEAMTADCGWIGSTSDVAKFVSCVFGESKIKSPLHASSTRKMISKPELSAWSGETNYFAMGWEVDNPGAKSDMKIRKEGCLPGSTALVVHRPDGTTCAIAFNSRPQQAGAFQDATKVIVEKALNSCKSF